MLRVTEIFYSIQGESATIGRPTTFVRLTGCPMRCRYCDTAYAFEGGSKQAIEEIVAQIKLNNTNYVTVTGGEPLAQPNCLVLLSQLCNDSYQVSLETGGAMDIREVDSRVYIVLDVKTPASGEEANNRYANLDYIKKTDALKFVICDEQDYVWSKALLLEKKLHEKCEVLFSPSSGQLSASDLADWVVRDQLPVRFQIQLHKVLWGNEQGR